MKIIEVKENKKQYLDLLLLADEQEDMVDRYLDSGKMYVLDDNGVKCECVITDEKNDILEIKNIATVPEYQGKGYANDINKATADFMLEQPWLSLFFYPYKRDCSADYVEQTEYDSDSENIRE